MMAQAEVVGMFTGLNAYDEGLHAAQGEGKWSFSLMLLEHIVCCGRRAFGLGVTVTLVA
jgi:hypothetical protein